jgi:hypothetical protein
VDIVMLTALLVDQLNLPVPLASKTRFEDALTYAMPLEAFDAPKV